MFAKSKMNVMNGRIFIKDWLKMKPYESQVSTDLYYLKLANEVKMVFVKNPYLSYKLEIQYDEILTIVSCFLTSYFEDIISQSGIWETFVSLHSKMYGKKIPFYSTKNYVDGEINQCDVSFLIWYVVNSLQKDEFIYPNNNSIKEASELIIKIFDREFEYALENEDLKSHYSLDSDDTDYYDARHLIDNILFRTYLFYPDTALQFQKLELDIIKSNKGEHVIQYLNESRDNSVHNFHTSLLALKGSEWAAAILGEDHYLYQDFLDMSPRIAGYFFYKGQDESEIFLEHIASGKQFSMTKKSYDYGGELNKVNTILFHGMVKWQNEWWFSGVNFTVQYNTELVEEERKSNSSKHQLDILDPNMANKAIDYLKGQKEVFLKYNNESLVAFMQSSEFEDYAKDFIDYYNYSLNFSKEEIEETKQRAKKEGANDSGEIDQDPLKGIDEPGLVFFNPNSGLEMAWGILDAFPLPENPYSDDGDSEDAIMTMLISQELSKELLFYAIENCKDKISFFKNVPGKIILEDIDFVLRFCKKENYHTKPALSLIG